MGAYRTASADGTDGAGSGRRPAHHQRHHSHKV